MERYNLCKECDLYQVSYDLSAVFFIKEYSYVYADLATCTGWWYG
jgi:hypothetical protein